MKMTRFLTLITVLILLFPTQAALAGRVPPDPIIRLTPVSITVPINATVGTPPYAPYKMEITNIPMSGLHCVRVELRVPTGYKVYPGTGYAEYHIYSGDTLFLNNLIFKVKVPNTAQRKFFYGTVSWSRDGQCKSIRTTNYSNQVEIIVKK